MDTARPVLEIWGPYDISWIRDLSNVYAFFVSDPFDRIAAGRESGQKHREVEPAASESLPRQWALAWIARDFVFLRGAEAICTLTGMDIVENLSEILDSSVWNERQKQVAGLQVGTSLTLSLPTRSGGLLELLFICQEKWYELLYRGVNETPLFTRTHSLFYQNFRSTPEAELLLDREAVIRDVNHAALALLGFSLQELLGKGIGTLFSPFLSLAKARSLQLFFNVHGQDLWAEEFALANGEGRYCTLQVTIQRLEGGGEQQLSFLSRLKDVSIQKNLELDMAHRDRALQLIVHNTSGLTGEKFFKSLLHQFVVLIKSKIALVGELVDEGRAIHPLAFWEQGQFRKAEPFSLSKTFCNLVIKKGEICFSRRLRELFPYDSFLQKRGLNSCWGLTLRRQDGTVIGILIAMDEKDIIRSPSRQVIGKVLQSLAGSELARLQTERVLQENERQLEIQNRELTRMNQLKSDMIAVTSHDLKSPLSAIIGYASLLEQYFATLTEEKKIYYIKRIEEEGQKQLVFINKLLDLYRIESGSIELEAEPQRLDLLVADCVETQKHVAAARNIVFDFRFTGEAIPLSVDRLRMDQVFSNLLSNAVKFSPDGEMIEVRCSQNKSFVIIEVCDRGKGVDEEEISHIFDRYYMGRTDFEVRAEGAGLGLYIVKSIVTLHGGVVCARNRKKGGSCFTVRLPAGTSGTEYG
ncbi:MAG: PAS domain-containing sensor histidine kinase, partial [Proteobacteria bacterium]|nr:PAS domain-containing sensor histidine kinase [Pseudomonadota bacterium]